MKKQSIALYLLALATVGLLLFVYLHRTEYLRETDPTGRYTAIYTYSTYLSYLPMFLDSSGDAPCFVKIVDARGEDLGEIPVSMTQLANVVWSSDGAYVKHTGKWDFKQGFCYYWSEDGDTKIFVRN